VGVPPRRGSALRHQCHEIGLAEVARIEIEMEAARAAIEAASGTVATANGPRTPGGSIAQFIDAVLSHGSVTLPILREIVDDYIARVKDGRQG
jgi:uncharacterized protein (DUF885 family)